MEDYPVAPALEEARTRARRSPNDAAAQWDLARSIADAPVVTDEQLGEALHAIDAAIGLTQREARYHWTRGYLLQRWSARLARSAADALQRAVELQPERPKNHFQYVAAMQQAGRSEDAVRYYLDLAKAERTAAMPYAYLAFAYYMARQYAEAAVTAADGLRLAPENAFLWYVQGEGLIGSGRAPEAEAALRRAIEIDREFVDVHYTLIELFERQERWADLAAEIRTLIGKLEPTDPTLPSLREKLEGLPR